MKKNLLIIHCLLLICMFLFGCGVSNEQINVPETNIETSAEDVLESIPETEYSSEIAANDTIKKQAIPFTDLPDDIKGTIIPMDSLMLYHIETGKEYDKTDSYMFWKVLHYELGNFGINYNRAEMTDYELAVEPMVIGEFATSFIYDYNESLPIPSELNDSVRYDDSEKMYYFGLGDRGLSQTEILSYEYIDNNTLKATARLFAVDDKATICTGEFLLKRNDYASGVIEPLFYFTVVEAEFEVE